MPRHFRSPQYLVFPQGVQAGPGATNMRLSPGSIVTLDDDTCVNHSRFINGRLRAGDLVELDEATAERERASAPRAEALRNPDPTKPMAKPGEDAAESALIAKTATALSKKGS